MREEYTAEESKRQRGQLSGASTSSNRRRKEECRRRRERGVLEFSEIWVVYSYSNTSVTLLLHLPLCSGSQEEQGQRAYSITILIRNINELGAETRGDRGEEKKRRSVLHAVASLSVLC
jgi:hypothetical protein